MIIGVPKEIKPQENRVGLIPASVRTLVQHGHKVLVQQGAGAGSMITAPTIERLFHFQSCAGSGLTDEEYIGAGGEIVPTAEEVWSRAALIWKVKEPLASEYGLIRPDQILYTYLHLAPDRPQTEALVNSGAVCFAYETIQTPNGALPLLAPMSEVAGRLSVQAGAHCLEKHQGGRGGQAHHPHAHHFIGGFLRFIHPEFFQECGELLQVPLVGGNSMCTVAFFVGKVINEPVQ